MPARSCGWRTISSAAKLPRRTLAAPILPHAAPTLYYANRIVPFGDFKNLAAYFDRLTKRPSFARTFEEAAPYRHLFPAA
jgi:glutathione S-transferase